MTEPASEATLFEQLGGKGAVDAAVELFYTKVLADERINGFFDGVDMPKQKNHMKAFLTYAFGGLPSYPGKSMRDAHKRLVEEEGLNDSHFDAVAENLQATLGELGVSDDLTQEVMAIAASTREDVLNR